MNRPDNKGLLDSKYAVERETKRSLRYRLRRRTHEALLAMEEFVKIPIRDIIDLGTADARMLNVIHQKYPKAHCVGVEYSRQLADFAKAKFPHLEIVQEDMQSLNFHNNSFDIAIATAVIEHIPDAAKMVSEVKRILRQGGIFILTSPSPFWERLAVLVGHIEKEQHYRVMTLGELRNLMSEYDFEILKSQRFMLSPVGMPFEFFFEKLLRRFRLDFLMGNQLLVAQRQ